MKNVSPARLSVQQETTAILLADRLGGAGGAGDTPPAGEVSGLVIYAPRGVQPVQPGYDVWAVEIVKDADGEEDVASAQCLADRIESLKTTITKTLGIVREGKKMLVTATHVVVNDHTGREVYRHQLTLKAA